MKMKSYLRSVFFLAACFLPLLHAKAAATWTGGGLTTNLWSEITNWDTAAVPEGDSVTFTNAGSTDVLGQVNNVLDTNLTITSYSYKAQVSFVGNITNYHTTLIDTGVTLTIDDGANSGNLINVGDTDPDGQDNQYYATITGTNASLIAGSTNSPLDTQGMQVVATSQSITNHIGSLDLSGLDNFTFAGGYVRVGASAANAAGATDRPVGRMYLARTNLIIANSLASDGSIRIGESKGNTPPRESQLELGHDNTFYTTYMKIGGVKVGPTAGGRMFFRPSLTNQNPKFTLRGADGVSRVTTLGIGENTLAAGSSIGSRGIVELSGGTVDVMVDTANIGRSTSGAGTGAASGTVTWTGGTVDIVTLNLGYQSGNTTGNATGTLNVRGTNANLVVGDITMARDGGTNTGRGIATLNLASGATASVSGTIAENSNGGDGTSTINITDSALFVGNTMTVDSLNLTNGTVSNAVVANVFNLRGSGNISGPITVASNLSPGIPIGTLTVSNDLTLSATATSTLQVNLDTLTADKVSVASNLTFAGTLVLTNIAGKAMATNGAAFKLFEAGTFTGAFAQTNLAPLGGFLWDTSTLGTDGTVRLVATVDTTPTNVVFLVSSNTVDIAWPASHTGWRLQTQSNSRSIGLSTNWVTVSGSDLTNHVITPLIEADGTIFYRLVYP